MFDFSYFPELLTERLILDDINRQDTRALFRLMSDERVTRYNDVSAFTDISDAYWLIDFLHERFAQQTGLRWAMRLRDGDGMLIGTCGFNVWHRRNRCGVIGYDLRPDYWNQGLTTEAVHAMVQFGFTKMALNRIEADLMAENHASARVLQKVGFMEEGTLRQRGYWKGQYHDLRLFSLLRVEYTGVTC